MSVISRLVARNLKVFLRDRTSVFFSFLSVIIIIGLYAIFLGKLQVNGIRNAVGDVPGVRYLVDAWIMSGLLAVNTVTVGLGALGIMVHDMENRLMLDFLVAPVNRMKIVVSYLISACTIGFLLSLVTLVVSQVYIVSNGGSLPDVAGLLKAVGIIALCVASSLSILFLFVTFIHTESAFSTLSTVLGTMIGFVAGIYVPVGVLPPAVQKLVNVVPVSHGAALLRQIFMEKPLQTVFQGAPENVAADYIRVYGVRLFWNDVEIGMPVMLGVLALSGLVFLVLSIFRLRRMKDL